MLQVTRVRENITKPQRGTDREIQEKGRAASFCSPVCGK